MVALERVNEYSILPREAPEYIEPRPPAAWPQEGRLEVDKLVIRYAVCAVGCLKRVQSLSGIRNSLPPLPLAPPFRIIQPDLPDVLHDLSFTVEVRRRPTAHVSDVFPALTSVPWPVKLCYPLTARFENRRVLFILHMG